MKRKDFLYFKGFNPIAGIYLNHEKICTNKSCFLPSRSKVTNKLKSENDLLVQFYVPKP